MSDPKGQPRRKLSYKLQRELEQLPVQIETLERRIAELETETTHPEFYTQDYTRYQPLLDELDDRRAALEIAVNRWAELEALTQL